MLKPLHVTLFLIAVMSLCSVIARAGEERFYVGTYTGKGSEGIYGYRFDPASGQTMALGLAARTDNPSFLAVEPKGRYLYAVNELDTFQGRPTGAVSAFAIDPGTGGLRFLQQISSLGGGPAHLSLDRTARSLLVANYGGGSVAVFPLHADGHIGAHTAFVQAHGSSVHPQRQAGPHAHCIQISPDNTSVVVADLGIDRLLVYGFEGSTGALTVDTTKFVRMEPGGGPRHIAFDPSGRFVYVNNEMRSNIAVFAYAGKGILEWRQTVSTLPAGFAGTNTTAEIVVDRSGRYLYVSNRGDDSIVVFSIEQENGMVSEVQRIPSGGTSPRHIAFDPSGRWLFAANARSNAVAIFRVDQGKGKLTATGQAIQVTTPVCVTFVP